jgi:nicotinamidase-related amidase
MAKALVIIDVQNYFMHENTHELPKKIVGHLGTNDYGTIAFSQFINSDSSPFRKIFNWAKCDRSPDIDICDELKPWVKKDNVFQKNGFSAFKSAKLLAHLYQHGVDEVYLCGTDTDACVMASAYDAFEAGFKVKVLYDLCASTNGRDYNRYAATVLKRNLETPPL